MRTRTTWNLVLGTLVTILALVWPLLSSQITVFIATEILIMGLFAVAFNLMLGYTGMVSFGHAAYFGIGGYATGLVLKKAGLSFALGLLAAPALGAFAALIIGYFCIRLTAIYFSMLTLAFAQIVWVISFKWYDFTGGDNGLIRIPFPEFVASYSAFYYFTLTLVAISLAILYRITISPFGQVLQAIRENPERAEFIGVNVKAYELLAFVISGLFSGLAGGLFTILQRGVYPDFIFWTKSAEVILMAILGGIYTFFGPLLGSAILIYLDKLISEYTEYWSVVLGTIFLLLLFFFPGGIMGFFQGKLQTERPQG
jgi:branched-chain amino acid transport system permease protein